MSPESIRAQAGMGLPVALFVLLVLGTLGLAVEQSSTTASVDYSHQIAAAQARYAARSAIEQQLPQVLAGTACSCSGVVNPVMTTVAGLNGCSVALGCESWVVNGQTWCTLTASARCDQGNASRRLEVRVR